MFVSQQRKHMETFLLEGKSKEEKKEEIRNFQMKHLIELSVETISSTKTRGQVTETLLKEVLKRFDEGWPCKKTNLNVGNGKFEFAWDFGDGKYIPIDFKFSEL